MAFLGSFNFNSCKILQIFFRLNETFSFPKMPTKFFRRVNLFSPSFVWENFQRIYFLIVKFFRHHFGKKKWEMEEIWHHHNCEKYRRLRPIYTRKNQLNCRMFQVLIVTDPLISREIRKKFFDNHNKIAFGNDNDLKYSERTHFNYSVTSWSISFINIARR